MPPRVVEEEEDDEGVDTFSFEEEVRLSALLVCTGLSSFHCDCRACAVGLESATYCESPWRRRERTRENVAWYM